MQLNIINEPNSAKDYEFIVVRPFYGNTYYYEHAFENGFEAEKLAKEIGGIIIHNVTIQGKKEEPKKNFYQINGTFTWGCWATSEEEARELFEEACSHEYDFDEEISIEKF